MSVKLYEYACMAPLLIIMPKLDLPVPLPSFGLCAYSLHGCAYLFDNYIIYFYNIHFFYFI